MAILVRTGKYRRELVERGAVAPTAVVDSIADVPGLLAGSARDRGHRDTPGRPRAQAPRVGGVHTKSSG